MPTTDPLLGEVLDRRYRLDALLANGGMATVYLAHDLRLQRQVAVKIPRPGVADGEDFLVRFRREALAHARLSHPHIVSIYDQGEDAGRVYLVLEYVPGRTLRDLLDDRDRLTPSQALAVLDPILQALDAAHDAGFAHRDIKPENVLLGRGDTIKLTDFGLARSVQPDGHQTLTLGTPAYISPEHVLGESTDGRSDVYTAGILLYELVTGSLPFAGGDPVALAFRHVHEDIPRPSHVVPGLPSEIDDLVMGAARRERDERFSGAAEMLRAVRQVRTLLPDPDPLPPSSGRLDTLDLRSASAALMLPKAASDDDVDAGSPPSTSATTEIAPATTDDASDPQPAGVVGLESGDTDADQDEADPQVDPSPPPGPAGRHDTPRLAAQSADRPHRPRRSRTRSRPSRPVTLTLLVVLVLVLGSGLSWALVAGPLQRVEVPTLAGLTEAEAGAALEELGLTLLAEQSDYSETVPKGEILTQDPGSGDTVFITKPISVVVSKGPERYQVPDVRGMSPEQAQAELESTNLLVGKVRSDYDEQVPEGNVARTNPKVGKPLKRDTEVTLIVSAGPAPIPVPDVLGQSRANAEKALTDVRLTSTTDSRYSEEYPKGQVMAVKPGVGTEVPRDSSVTLTISKGPPPVEVPNVVDMRMEDAVRTLEAKGLVVRVEQSIVTPLDRVFSQSPGGGTVIPKGSTVTIQIF